MKLKTLGAVLDDVDNVGGELESSFASKCCARIDGCNVEQIQLEYYWGCKYLLSVYSQSNKTDTFNAYRRELEKLFQYCWFGAGVSVFSIQRLVQAEEMLSVLVNPHESWLTFERQERFQIAGEQRARNKHWRPYWFKVSKSRAKQIRADLISDDEALYIDALKAEYKRVGYSLSGKSIDALVSVLKGFFRYLVVNEVVNRNPFEGLKKASIRSHNSGVSLASGKKPTRMRLSNECIDYVIDLLYERYKALEKAVAASSSDEGDSSSNALEIELKRSARAYYAFSLMFKLYLRVSDLSVRGSKKEKLGETTKQAPKSIVAINNRTPVMSDFVRINGLWFLNVFSKGSKWRERSINDDIMALVVEYRKFRGLATPYPTADEDQVPIIPSLRSGVVFGSRNEKDLREKGITRSAFTKMIQSCFDYALEQANADGKEQLISELSVATSHWLRHTGISVESHSGRNPTHIMADSGHESYDSMRPYMDDDHVERHKSNKTLT